MTLRTAISIGNLGLVVLAATAGVNTLCYVWLREIYDVNTIVMVGAAISGGWLSITFLELQRVLRRQDRQQEDGPEQHDPPSPSSS